jgi:hypothetical protein
VHRYIATCGPFPLASSVQLISEYQSHGITQRKKMTEISKIAFGKTMHSKLDQIYFISLTDHHHNALRDLGLMACSDLIFTNPIVFSVDVPVFFSLMVGSSE